MNRQELYDLVTLGESMGVMSPVDAAPLDCASALHVGVGGAESNVSIGLARLGHSVQWVSRVGNDPFGRKILRTMRAEGIDVSCVSIDPLHATGIYFKEWLPDGVTRAHYYRKDSAAAHLSLEDANRMAVGRYLLVTGITVALSASSRAAVERAVERAHLQGMKIILDPNIRKQLWPSWDEALRILGSLAQQADIIVPGIAEGEAISGHHEAPDIAQWFLERKPGVTVVIKLGQKGAYYHNAVESGYVKGFRIRERDEVGAGDAFSAGLISGLLDHLPWREAVTRACALGAMVAAIPGDFEGLPTREDLARFIASQNEPHQ